MGNKHYKILAIFSKLPPHIHPYINQWQEKKFFLEALGLNIKLPDGVKIRYRYKEGQGKLKDKIPKEIKSFLERESLDGAKVLGTVIPDTKAGTIDIIVPDMELLRSYEEINHIDPKMKEHWNKFYLEFVRAHEEAHALQYSCNYKLLVDFVKDNLGKTDYIDKMYKFAEVFDRWLSKEWKLWKIREVSEWRRVVEEWAGLYRAVLRIHRNKNREEIKEVLQNHADICATANLIRKGYMKAVDPEIVKKKIVRENFREQDLMEYLGFEKKVANMR